MSAAKSRVDQLLDSVEQKAVLLRGLRAEIHEIRLAPENQLAIVRMVNRRLHDVAKLVKSMQSDAESAFNRANFEKDSQEVPS